MLCGDHAYRWPLHYSGGNPRHASSGWPGGWFGLYFWPVLAPKIVTLTLAYGVVTGIGVGITYGVPMAVMARWFPDRKGLAVGLTVVGFRLIPFDYSPPGE